MRSVDLSIGQRLAIGFGTILVLLVLQVVSHVYQAQRIEALEHHRDYVLGPRVEAANEVQVAHLRKALSIRGYALTEDERHLQGYQQAGEQARDALRELEGAGPPPDEAAVFRELSGLASSYSLDAASFITLVQQGASEDALHAAEIELAELHSELLDRAQVFLDLQLEHQLTVAGEVEQARAERFGATVLLATLILGVGIATAFFTTQAVRNPARHLLEVARALRSGDYRPALALEPPSDDGGGSNGAPRDELRELAHSFGRTAVVLKHRETRLAAHAQVSATLASTIDVERLGDEGLREVAAYATCEFGALYLLDSETATLRRTATYALDGAAAQIAVGEGIPGQAAADGRVTVVRNIPAEAPFRLRFGFDEVPPRTVAAFPIGFGQRLIGVMLLGSVRDLSDETLGFLEDTARQMGVSLQNALSHREVARLAGELQDRAQELEAQNEELQAQSEELQAQNEEIQAQNEELERQRVGLAEADRLKDEFFSIASHELKSPITSLKGFAQLLRRHAESRPDLQEFVTRLDTISQQADLLVERINRLLDVSRATTGRLQMHPEPIDLVSLARQQAEQAQARTSMHRISVEGSAEQLVGHWDHSYLQQALGNLLDNAIRYSPDGGHIRVVLGAEGGEARLSVSDDGIGIPADVLPSLFQPYFRHQAAKEVVSEGMGIGLYVTREIIIAHGGRISVESQVGGGATFNIALPLPARGRGAEPAV